jgi:hypothetical protein
MVQTGTDVVAGGGTTGYSDDVVAMSVHEPGIGVSCLPVAP